MNELENKMVVTLKTAYNNLLKENAELKQQLDRLHKNETIYHKRLVDIKYLNKVEVEKIIDEYADIIEVQEGIYKTEWLFYKDDIDEIITAICSLAIKPITKDKIIGVLNKYWIRQIDNNVNPVEVKDIEPEQIANEIIDKD